MKERNGAAETRISGGRLAEAACRYLGAPYSAMDCQAFAERVLADCGLRKNLPGSNAWYREILRNGWAGTPEECRKRYGKIPPGAFLFILEPSGGEPAKYRGDGVGNASHIGLFTGLTGKEMAGLAARAGVRGAAAWNYGDGAVHSSASRGRVCTSRFRGKSIPGGWNRVGLWSRIEYGIQDTEYGLSAARAEDGPRKAENPGKGDGRTKTAYRARVKGGALNLRKGMSVSSGRICRIPDGAEVAVTEDFGGWSAVEYGGRSGFVMTRWLEEIRPEQAGDTVSGPEPGRAAPGAAHGEIEGLPGLRR